MPNQRAVFFLIGILSNWLLILAPIVVGAPIALLIWKMAPTQYEAKSTILMLSANRGSDGAGGAAGFPRQNAVEQIAVLEAWLKSDSNLSALLPQIFEGSAPTDTLEVGRVTNLLRRSLTLQLVGAAVLEVRLEGSEAKGLGRKLEIIVTRLLEGLINPEAGILTAGQLIMARRGEAVAEAEAVLDRAIHSLGLEGPAQVKSRLQTLYALKKALAVNATTSPRISRAPVSDGATAAQPSPSDSATTRQVQELDDMRATFSPDPRVVKTLESLYDAYEEARMNYQDVRNRASSSTASYVGVFDAPERLTVIGRPQDPIVGQSSGQKLAIAVMLLAVLFGLALAAIAVWLDRHLWVNADFEEIARVPVLARLPLLHPRR